VLQVVNVTRGQKLATAAKTAKSLFSRLRGLLFRGPLSEGEGLYLVPCSAIHMVGMSFPIDAIFVDRAGEVVGLVKNIQPWGFSQYYWRARGCLELPAGTIDATNTNIGDALMFQES
jgi:hypothetical protein